MPVVLTASPFRSTGRRLLLAVALVLVVAGSLLGGTPARASAATVNSPMEWQFLDLLNSYRAAQHVPVVAMSSGATGVARPWSGHMAATNTLAHNPAMVSQLAHVAPSWSTLGENVGEGYSVSTLNQAFINSAPHRANMVNAAYNYVGIGVVTSGSTIWVTVDFVGSRTALAVEPRPSASPAPAISTDFAGRGSADKAIYRPSTGTWYILGRTPFHWGEPTDLPVPGHYSGTAAALPALFRPSTGQWFFWGLPTVSFGQAGDIPTPGDYDGDGRTDIAVFRPSNETWYVRNHAAVQFGQAGDVPVPAAYAGGRTAQIALWRPGNGTWYVRGHAAVQFGQTGDIPVPGQYDGGSAEITIYRPSQGMWYVRNHAAVRYGSPGDVPVPAVFLGGRTTLIAVWRPSDGGWYLCGHATQRFGVRGDRPLH